MATEIDIKAFARMGITVKEVTENDLGIHVVLTAQQFGKLTEVLGAGGAHPTGVQSQYVIATVDTDMLQTAIDENARAPRASRTTPLDDRISSRMVYDVTIDPDDVNLLTHAEYEAGTDYGFAHINGVDFPILTVPAIQVYPNAADTNPNRPVFVIEYLAKGEVKQLSSYGITNLLRRVMTCKDQMTPVE